MIASSTFVAADGEGYELNMGRWSRRLVGSFLDFVGMDRAERVLDVGCGTGHLARAASELDDTVEVHGVDLSEAYVKYAAAHCANPKRAYRVGDACALEYQDGAFDRVLALLVLHFVPRWNDAIAEMRRVARSGATVAATVWDARGGFVANRLFFDTAAVLDPRTADRRARNYTRPLTRTGELAAAWRNAGFVAVTEATLHVRMEYASFSDFWVPYLGKDGPGPITLAHLTRTHVNVWRTLSGRHA